MTFHFQIARLPRIVFGPGSLSALPKILIGYGQKVLIVTGATSFQSSSHWSKLSTALFEEGFEWELIHVAEEPSPMMVDDTVRNLRSNGYHVVVGIGGGSALDAAKAIAGLIKPGNSVMDHLEGMGPELPYQGPSTPFIAIPTTAGTGSEATKNAVLSQHGESGFKKSFRDEALVAEYAIIDPDLLESCPPAIIAANGMDALTQLLESYVSIKANPLTDALALNGLESVRDHLLAWHAGESDAAEHRCHMAYAALLSGITLAQVGLGSVHGLAAPLGAYFPIPHGVACGTLVSEATRVNIRALQERQPDSPILEKYANVGRLLSKTHQDSSSSLAKLVDTLESWTAHLNIARLGHFGISTSDIPRIVANSRGSSMKTNPVVLSDAEIARLLSARI